MVVERKEWGRWWFREDVGEEVKGGVKERELMVDGGGLGTALSKCFFKFLLLKRTTSERRERERERERVRGSYNYKLSLYNNIVFLFSFLYCDPRLKVKVTKLKTDFLHEKWGKIFSYKDQILVSEVVLDGAE